ncbi:exopolysaccharide biosynthesis polyprenyl glycosylphosphotransferase [Acetoanaerobium pronyense]|uniref:Exopolysaccharide biosynthesis polyprenyl glycosylphosphotransferase n=1 Tax=Acetoanaerobium pronyense TaxID=1482736 RepID=A0ABS4KH64_9FIRM|nr:sugar transferase [Acetoanaerobium pronyense]MBP2027130.1 exopolysaccharide biosynthesis polyprenyl glycosylphosphotransferase [Acetoanaerobium pronyense]
MNNLFDFLKKNKSDGLLIKIIELIAYLFIVHLGYWIAFKLEFFSVFGYDERNINAYSEIWPYITLFSAMVLLFNNTFKMIRKNLVEIIATMTIVVLMINIGTLSIAFFSREFALPRSLILQAVVIHFFLFITVKVIFIKFLRKYRGTKNIVVIGPIEDKENTMIKILSSNSDMDRVKFYIDPNLIEYERFIEKADKIFISDMVDNKIKDDIISTSIILNKSLYIVPKTFEIAIYKSEIVQFSDIPAFKVENLQLSVEKKIIKRAFDIVFSSLALLILSPVILITSFSILAFDGMPIFYTQERATINNKKFNIIKFRSMIKDAEKATGAIWASHDDNRITPIGKILRRFWLDEIPQLFNVLKGDMSLVGPRPERPFFIEEFNKNIPSFEYRLTVKAGVTGLAQILGKYSTTPEYKIKYDLMYIRNVSIYYDILIIVETIKKIIIGTLQRGENKEDEYEAIKEQKGIIETKNENFIEYNYFYEK